MILVSSAKRIGLDIEFIVAGRYCTYIVCCIAMDLM
jgi:hypothetical protein